MEVVKKTGEYTILKKRSGRYGVRSPNNRWVNGEEKMKILIKEGLIKEVIPAKKEEAPASGSESES